MKRLLILTISAILCFTTARAQQYTDIKNSIRELRSYTLSKSNTKKLGGYIDLGYVQNTRRGEASFCRVELLSSYGYHTSPYFYIGGGIGMNYVCKLNEFYMPVTADVKLNIPLNVGKTSLFTDCKIGYAFGIGDAAECGGFYMTPSVGINIGKLYFSAGYALQRIFWDFDSNFNEVNVSLTGISIRVGIRI